MPATPAKTLAELAHIAPSLAKLAEGMRESSARLKSIQPLIPLGLRASVKAGPIEAEGWCLVVGNAAAAAKLRQLVPAFLAHLRTHGLPTQSIRLKVIAPTR